MEIKNYPFYPSVLNPTAGIKMGEHISRDRDADQGGKGYQNPSKEERNNPYLHRPLTEEEFELAIKKLAEMTPYREANLSHRVETNADGKRVVLILDPQQNVIKRLTETELGTAFLLQREDEAKGSLINKNI